MKPTATRADRSDRDPRRTGIPIRERTYTDGRAWRISWLDLGGRRQERRYWQLHGAARRIAWLRGHGIAYRPDLCWVGPWRPASDDELRELGAEL